MDPKTIEAYDRIAAAYGQQTDDFWDKIPSPTLIDLFVARLAGEDVLDVGSGTGRDALIFRRYGLKPVCLDASVVMAQRTAQQGFPSVRGDFTHLPFVDASFDGVWAHTSLLHIPKRDIDRPFSEIRRVLKPGGALGLGFLKGDGEEYRDTLVNGNPRWFSNYHVGEVANILTRNGFHLRWYREVLPTQTRPVLHFLARA